MVSNERGTTPLCAAKFGSNGDLIRQWEGVDVARVSNAQTHKHGMKNSLLTPVRLPTFGGDHPSAR